MADVNINKFRASVVRDGSKPASPGFIVSEGQDPVNPPGTNNYVPYSGATANVELGEYGVEAGFITLDTTPTNTPTDQGTIFWDADDETVDIVLNGYTMKIGEDLFYPVKNQTGSTIAKGVAVRFNGTVGNSGRLLIAPFIADGSVPSTRFMGVTAEEILNGEDGKVLYFGRVRGINTNAFNEGDILYASTTVAGGYQTAIPVAPNNIVQVAAVVTKSATVGTIFVRPTLGSNINKDEGVKITSVADKNLLQYQSGTALWENKTLAQVLGGTSSQFVKGDGSLDSTTYGTGTVTSVGLSSATSGVTIGSTPVTTSGTITLAIATASGSQNGLLSSTDWTTFNSKQNALTNPVTGTGTTNTLAKFTGASTIGNSLFTDNGTNGAFGGANYYAGTDLRTFNISAPLYAGLSFWANNQNVANIVGYGVTGNLILNADQGNLFSNTKIILSIDDTERFAVFSNGNVSIANSPTDNGAKLQVNGSSRLLDLIGGGDSFARVTGNRGNANDVHVANLEFYNSYSSRLVGEIRGITGTGGTQSNSGQLTFYTNDNGTYAERLRITSTGNLGFGTPTPSGLSPSKMLNIYGGGGIGGELVLEGNSGGNFISINSGTSAGDLPIMLFNRGLRLGHATAKDATGFSEAMRITSIGNVVINNSGTSASLASQFVNKQRSDTTTPYLNGISNMANSNSKILSIYFDGNNNKHVIAASYYTSSDGGAFSPLTLQTTDIDRLTITTSGDVLIGLNSATAKLSVQYSDASNNGISINESTSAANSFLMLFRSNNVNKGSIQTNSGNTGVLYNTTSDYRFKEDLKDYSGIEIVSKIKTYDFKWKNSEFRSYGVLAHELQELIPDIVGGLKDKIDKNGEIIPQGVDYGKLTPILIKAIQELKQEIDTLKN